MVSHTITRRDKTIVPVSPLGVEAVAATLEATLVMNEDTPTNDHTVMLSVRLDELQDFVAYMRQLDREYRDLIERFGALQDQFSTLAGKVQHESKAAQETPQGREISHRWIDECAALDKRQWRGLAKAAPQSLGHK
jgi:hypothetical protein